MTRALIIAALVAIAVSAQEVRVLGLTAGGAPLGEQGCNYYVDALNGLDTNAGTSPQAAWQTVAKVNATAFVAGQKVCFRRGQGWREQLTIPTAGSALGTQVYYQSYGRGPKPLFIASDVIPGPWTVSSGSIYVADVVGMWDAGAAWVDVSTVLVKAANLAGLNAAGMFFPDVGNAKFYVWLPDSSNPTAHTIEANRRTYGVLSQKRWVTIKNIAVRHASRGISFENAAPISQGSFVQFCDVSYSYGQGVYSEIWTLTVEDSTFTGIWNGKAYGGGGAGSAIRFVGANALDNVARRNTITSAYVGVDTTTSKGAKIYRNTILSSKVNGIGAGSADTANPALIYHNSVLHNPVGTNGHGIVAQDATGDGVVVKNNLIVSTFTGTPTNVQCVAIGQTNYTTITIENNLYWVAAGSTARLAKLGSNMYDTMADWRTALGTTTYTGKDAHAVNADPTISLSTLIPVAGSPAIDAGAVLAGYNDDYQGTGPDIGFHEVK